MLYISYAITDYFVYMQACACETFCGMPLSEILSWGIFGLDGFAGASQGLVLRGYVRT